MMIVNPCCCSNCTYFSDNFDRADSSNLGSDWTEVAGGWEIVSNTLVTSDNAAVLVGTVEQPLAEPNTLVTVTATVSTNGCPVRIILDYQDSSNYWFAEVLAGTGAYIRIYRRSGGSNTQVASKSITQATGSFTFAASIKTSDRIAASIGSNVISFGGSFTSPKWGLGTGTIAAQVQFSNLSVSETNETNCPGVLGITSCSYCSPNNTAAYTYKIVLAGITNGGCSSCSSLNGTYYCTPATPGVGVQACVWRFTTPSICSITWAIEFQAGVQAGAFGPGSMGDSIAGVVVDTNGADGVSQWWLVFGASPPNCTTDVNGSIPFFLSGVSNCNFSSATATVTALV